MMKSSETSLGNLEEEAKRRKQRLEELRNEKARQLSDSDQTNSQTVLPKPKFRSYNPRDDTLKQSAIPKAKPESIEEQLTEELSSKPEALIDEVDLSSLAPRKVDWDLKRNIANKLEKLEKRTQRAIAELIRERLKTEDSGNLLEATQAMNTINNVEQLNDV